MYEEKMSASGGKNEKNEQKAIIIGLFLILLVIVITLFRSNLFSGSDKTTDQSGQNSQEESSLGYKTITAKDLQKKLLLAPKDSVISLIDVRPFDSYAKEHLVDSINIATEDFPINTKIDVNNLAVVIGENADDENINKIVDELKKENFQNFLVLAGGMEVWKQNGGPTVTYGDPTSIIDQSKVSYVEPENLNDALKQNVPMFIVDVRSSDDYAKGHISGAKNIPDDDLEKRRSEITEKKVVVVGMNELQEFQAAVKMYDMLLVSPFVLKGAMPQWEQKGFPVTN
jgi:rhodanese-related sulfurtransferase